MSERSTHPEHHHPEVTLEQPEHKERHEHIPKQTPETKHDHNMDKLKESIHQEALSIHEQTIVEHRYDTDQSVLGVQRELKARAYRQTLHKVQAHLRPSEQTFSKLIHQPKVEALSEVSAKTIARPWGILCGGLAALLGSGYVLYVSKHNGFRYNFFVCMLLFVGGYTTGILIELCTRIVRRRQT